MLPGTTGRSPTTPPTSSPAVSSSAGGCPYSSARTPDASKRASLVDARTGLLDVPLWVVEVAVSPTTPYVRSRRHGAPDLHLAAERTSTDRTSPLGRGPEELDLTRSGLTHPASTELQVQPLGAPPRSWLAAQDPSSRHTGTGYAGPRRHRDFRHCLRSIHFLRGSLSRIRQPFRAQRPGDRRERTLDRAVARAEPLLLQVDLRR